MSERSTTLGWVHAAVLAGGALLGVAASHGQIISSANQRGQELYAREDMVLGQPIALYLCTIAELDAGADYLNCPDVTDGLRVRIVGEQYEDGVLVTKGAFSARVYLLKPSGERNFLGLLRSRQKVTTSGAIYLEAIGFVFAPDAEPGDRIGVKVIPRARFRRLKAGQSWSVTLGAS